MYVVIVGGGKVGLNLARELIRNGQEVTLIENDRRTYLRIEQELEHAIQYGDGTELWVLERGGIQRADLVVAVTGDDEDNILICQVAKEKYLCERIIARCNNPRNLQHFKLLGIQPAVSATDLILNLIEHEVPGHGLVHLLDLPDEQLEIIEVEVLEGAPAAGRKVSELNLPEGSLIISVLPRGKAGFVPKPDTIITAGDEVLVVLDPGLEPAITAQFAAGNGRGQLKVARRPRSRRRRFGDLEAGAIRTVRVAAAAVLYALAVAPAVAWSATDQEAAVTCWTRCRPSPERPDAGGCARRSSRSGCGSWGREAGGSPAGCPGRGR